MAAPTTVELIRELGRRMAELIVVTSTSAGLTSTVVSNQLDAYFPATVTNLHPWVWCMSGANAGQEARGSAWAQSAHTLTLLSPGFLSATESGVEYEVHLRTPRSRKLEALNSGVRQLGLYWPREVVDDSLVSLAGQHEYRLDSAVNWARITDVQIQHILTETAYTRTGASQFTATTPSYASIASNASLLTGDVDQWFSGWFYLDSLGVGKTLLAKSDTAGTGGSYRITAAGSNVLRFELTNDGTNVGRVELNYSSTPLVVNRWYFFFAYYDAVNNLMGLILDNGAAVTIAQTGGAFANTTDFRLGARSSSGVINTPHNGRLETVALGKSPVGGIAALLSTLPARLYNNGVPVRYADLTSAEKTAWGLVSWWRGDETTGADRDDSHGTNHLTSSGVTATTGVEAIYDPTSAVWPYDDGRDLRWDIRTAQSAGGVETTTLILGDLPPTGYTIRVIGEATFSELADDTDILPIVGRLEGAAFEWLMRWAKFQLLDESVEMQPTGQTDRYKIRAQDMLVQQGEMLARLIHAPESGRIVVPGSSALGPKFRGRQSIPIRP